jgi:hypothetical protein
VALAVAALVELRLVAQQLLERLTQGVAVVAAMELAAQVVPASSSSRSTNKDIHAKQSLSILWNQHGNGTAAPRS